MQTKTLLNHYLQEVDNKTVNIHEYVMNQDNEIVVIDIQNRYYFIPLLEYITFVFNKS